MDITSLNRLAYITSQTCYVFKFILQAQAAAEEPAAAYVYVTYQPSLTLFNAKNSNRTGSGAKLQLRLI